MWQHLLLEDLPKKYINLVQALYLDIIVRVRAYAKLSSKVIQLVFVRLASFPHFYLTLSLTQF